MRRVVRFSSVLAVCVAVLPGVLVRGEGTPNGVTVVKVAVSGSAIQRPALRWMMLPEPREMQEGNAAVQYGMASATFLSERPTGKEQQELEDSIDKLNAGPLGEMDVGAAQKIVTKQREVFRGLRDGARRETCSWQLPLRQEGVYTLLPYLGPMRQMCRRLALGIRVDIRNHDWAGAQDKLQTGDAVARKLSHGQTIVESLVGAAIAGQMNNCVKDWISEAGSPNVFWGIAEMPSPLTPLEPGIRWERSFIYFDLPEWGELERGRAGRRNR